MRSAKRSALGLSGIAVIFVQSVCGQITIEQADMEKIFKTNSVLLFIDDTSFASDTGGVVNVGQTGGPNIYDFSSLTYSDTTTVTNYPTSTFPFAAARFPSAGFVGSSSPQEIQDGYGYVMIYEQNILKSLGNVSISDTVQIVQHDIPHGEFFKFPSTYNTSWTTTGGGMGVETTYVNNQMRSAATRNSAGSSVIDGFGTLVLPIGMYQCLRRKFVEPDGYHYKEFVYITKDGIMLYVGSAKTENDTGDIAANGVSILKGTNVNSLSNSNITPKHFSLLQNYPNPFNPATEIRYQIPEASRVTLEVFDAIGRAVATLVNETQEAGIHLARFDATRLSTGVYMYRLRAGNFVSSKKLLLLR